MKAMILEKVGFPLRMIERPEPHPGAEELLLRVEAELAFHGSGTPADSAIFAASNRKIFATFRFSLGTHAMAGLRRMPSPTRTMRFCWIPKLMRVPRRRFSAQA